jgi:hypothetical protein
MPRSTLGGVFTQLRHCPNQSKRLGAALKAPELPRTTRRRFRSIGRGHALQRIDLYPVRAQAPSSHNRYSRVPKPESAGGEPNYY